MFNNSPRDIRIARALEEAGLCKYFGWDPRIVRSLSAKDRSFYTWLVYCAERKNKQSNDKFVGSMKWLK